jgi:AcrR family transcriptional regulator
MKMRLPASASRITTHVYQLVGAPTEIGLRSPIVPATRPVRRSSTSGSARRNGAGAAVGAADGTATDAAGDGSTGRGAAPSAATAAAARSTRDRILDAALVSFGTRGFEATSLDHVAAELGVRKQTILYYHPSKVDLLDAVIDRSALELAAVFEATLARAGEGFDRIEAVVRSTFRLAIRRPELLGLLREVSRLGDPAATRLSENVEPLVDRARAFLEAEMDAGRFRPGDARLLLLSVYSTVVGVATEVEVLRAIGIEPTLRATVVRRREVLTFLRRALVVE